MFVCAECGRKFKTIIYGYNGTKLCRECAPLHSPFHLNNIEITDKGPTSKSPFEDLSEAQKRDRFIALLYLIFDKKINPAAYRLMNNYYKTRNYTWLGMTRAIEWFYVIRKNSLKKSNNNIGIIPYIYKDAQKFYKAQNQQAFNKALKWYNNRNQKINETIVKKKQEKKKDSIDMEDLF